jgi:hypothetical protein
MQIDKVGFGCTRGRKFSREADMTMPVAELILSSSLNLSSEFPLRIMFEIATDAGIPDLVLLELNETEMKRRQIAKLGPVIDGASMRVLDSLENGPLSMSDLSRVTALSASYLRTQIVTRLAGQGWIDSGSGRGGHTVVSPLWSPPSLVRWAATVELKKSNWLQATSQARRHVEFADQAYIALDKQASKTAKDNLVQLKEMGIGLITVDAGSDSAQYESHPQAQLKLNNNISRRLLGERAWKLIIEGRNTGSTFPVFGKDLALIAKGSNS